MSLTMGVGPHSGRPAGTFNVEIEPATGSVLFFDPVPQRIRVVFEKETIVDTERAKMLHESAHLPVYYIPEDDVAPEALVPSEKRTHCPHKGEAHYYSLRVGERTAEDAVWFYPEPIDTASFLRGYVALYWNAVDEWFAEDEQLFGHPRDPYARIDVYPTSRHIRILLDGEVIADTVRAKALFESNLPTRWYIPPDDVRTDLLETSGTHTRCAYKGAASHFHARVGDSLHEDVAWTYSDPEHDADQVRDHIAFYNERVDVELDGTLEERPDTPWRR